MTEHNGGEIIIDISGYYVPWSTGFDDYEEEISAVTKLYPLYWGNRDTHGQPVEALAILQALAENFRVKHYDELARAQQWHAAEGTGAIPISQAQDGPGFNYVWPVEKELYKLEDLHRAWSELAGIETEDLG